MSERGSFVTEYLYCDRCSEAVGEALKKADVELVTPICVTEWREDQYCPPRDEKAPLIWAGKIHGLYAGEELHVFERLCHELGPKLCPGHSVTFAVLPDSAPPAFLTSPPPIEAPPPPQCRRCNDTGRVGGEDLGQSYPCPGPGYGEPCPSRTT